MKLYVKNNVCCLQSQGGLQTRSFLLNYVTSYERVKQRVVGRYGEKRTAYVNNPVPLYTTFKQQSIYNYVFPRGIYEMIPQEILDQLDSVVDESTNDYSVSPSEISADYLSEILQPESGFDLRDDQIMAVTKALLLKRGVMQLPTGSGKTEVMSAVIKVLKSKYPNIHILVIEPTDVLVRNTAKRFNKYELDAVAYNESRNELSHTVTVSHPASLLNDLKKDPKLLSDMNVVFWDECQHCQCDTWKSLNNSLCDVEYAIGLSALAVDESHLYTSDIQKLSLEESLIIGATGKVIMYVPAKYYIDKGILTTPVIFQFHNKLNNLEKVDDWHKLRKEGIQSYDRSLLTATVTNMFVSNHRRVLILVGTKTQAYDISEILSEKFNLFKDIAISFGGGESLTVDPEDFSKTVSYKDNIVDAFDQGDFSIIISTSHMDEGVDLSNLDVVILASGGKKDRRIVQRIGRALRLTKTGKFAYIVDFSDTGNGVLEYHASLRMSLYTNLIEVPKDLIFKNISIEFAYNKFKSLENIKED